MSGESFFDMLAKSTAKAVNRRQALRGLAVGLGGAALALVGVRTAHAAPPQTCVICACGTGRPCNVKEMTCTELREFPGPETACEEACTRQNLHVCSAGEAFHCPHGCPA
jgi:hypothetical protein